jgi:lysophospholipase L1-like esterase
VPAVLWGLLFRLIRGLFGRPRRRTGRGVVGAGTLVVACLGSSATDAAGSYDWINDLSQRPGNAGLRFYRFAEGGDLAYNGLARVPDIVGCQPDYAVVLLGGNDVLALVSAKHAQFVRMTKHLPKAPSPEWYRESMGAVARRLKSDTHARIGLCSLTPIGEDPGSTDRFQAQVNLCVQQYSAVVKDIAQQEAVSYIPVYERIHELILASPGQAFTAFNILPFYRDVFRQFVLHQSNDEIGQLNGWQFHRDGIHLNSRSGKVVADLVQQFLDAPNGVAAG